MAISVWAAAPTAGPGRWGNVPAGVTDTSPQAPQHPLPALPRHRCRPSAEDPRPPAALSSLDHLPPVPVPPRTGAHHHHIELCGQVVRHLGRRRHARAAGGKGGSGAGVPAGLRERRANGERGELMERGES